MAGKNLVIILGNMGKDPDVTTTQSGLTVCKFSLATSKKLKNGTMETAWHRCVAFGKTGELISQYVKKGNQLYVEGELKYGQYEKDGITRYTTDIIVNQITFVGSNNNNQQGNFQNNQQPQQGNFQPQQNNYNPPPNNQQGQIPAEDDIPF